MAKQLDLMARAEQMERSRDTLMKHVYKISHEIAVIVEALELEVMIYTVARMSTSRRYPDGLDPVDWDVDQWGEKLLVGRSTAYKILKMAQEAGAIRGTFGELIVDVAGLIRWACGDEPTELTVANILAASGSKKSQPKAPESSKRRTDPSKIRTDSSKIRTVQNLDSSKVRTDSSRIWTDPSRIWTDTYISNKLTTDTESVQKARPDSGRVDNADSGPESGAGTAQVFLGEGLPDYLLALPEIADALTRPIDPLPAGELIRGTFNPALRDCDMGSLEAMVLWYRRQRSLPDPPVTGSTEAHLLVVISIALFAARMDAAQVRRNRVAVFVSTLTQREFRRGLRYVAEARGALDRDPALLQRDAPSIAAAPTASSNQRSRDADSIRRVTLREARKRIEGPVYSDDPRILGSLSQALVNAGLADQLTAKERESQGATT